MTNSFDTHIVENQPESLDGVNLYDSDRALKASIEHEGAKSYEKQLGLLGQKLGQNEMFEKAQLANTHLPVLKTHDNQGRRKDQVDFHPTYHEFMKLSKSEGIHVGAYSNVLEGQCATPGSGVARAAKHYLMSQVEAGHICPITMTHASIPTLQIQPSLADKWLPGILSHNYDPGFKPAAEKSGLTIGMGMTEKQGGSDVRANSTRAVPEGAAGAGKPYLITGHKWFMSAPMCDAFLVLAYAQDGLSVFLTPRFKDDGTINGLRFQRLKDKLGNKSNASSEVEFANAQGFLIGEEGRGIANIMTMANLTRMDCALGSAGIMRQALLRAVYFTRQRRVFQKTLVDQPMMSALLADMSLEVEAATLLSMRLSGAYERESKPEEAAYARVMTPVTKYWVTKRGPAMGYEAMECLGGIGYVEDNVVSRLYRELPLNSIWEGSGSVMCLDLLRVLYRSPDSVEVIMSHLASYCGHDASFKAVYEKLSAHMISGALLEAKGRWLTETLAVLGSAILMVERSTPQMAEAYISTRLNPENSSFCYGVMPDGINTAQIISEAVCY